jgi:site-specific DNA-methyltransferase (adenine-specific)
MEALKAIPDATVDAVVTDPPYELGFMNKGWDASGIAFSVTLWREVLRVLKPGGYILAFGGTRTYHRMTCAIEDAGADIRDCILAWKYGSGFPKSMNVSIAIDKASGAMGHRGKRVSVAGNRLNGGEDVPNAFGVAAHEPITDDAKAWAGWGTALKPAWEPVVVARKPLEGTVAANVLKYGTGAMNIDASRVPTSDRLGGGHSSSGQQMSDGWHRPWMDDPEAVEANAARSRAAVEKAEALGRWPANILLTHAPDCSDEGCVAGCPCAAMDEQSGGDGASRFFNRLPIEEDDLVPFFYTPKASRSEREAGCDALEPKTAQEAVSRDPESAGAKNPRAGANRGAGAALYYCSLCDISLQGGRAAKACAKAEDGQHVPEARGQMGAIRNNHPTVKPISIMEWCLTLVAREGAVVLDPFMGSGTTGIAAVRCKVNFIGIEREEEYLRIAEARIRHHGGDPEKA